MVLDLAVVLIEVLAAIAGDGDRVDLVVAALAEEDAARVELVTAQLGHEPAAGLAIEPPADELIEIVETVPAQISVAEMGRVLGRNPGPPAVGVDPRRIIGVALGQRPGVVAMP